jgi:hypothetical protein
MEVFQVLPPELEALIFDFLSNRLYLVHADILERAHLWRILGFHKTNKPFSTFYFYLNMRWPQAGAGVSCIYDGPLASIAQTNMLRSGVSTRLQERERFLREWL